MEVVARPRPGKALISKNQLADAIAGVKGVAAQLFEQDARVHAVGVGITADGSPVYRAVRNTKKIVAQAAKLTLKAAKTSITAPFPIVFVDARNDAAPLFRMPFSVAAFQGAAAQPEQQLHRPLRCGLQIQNFDDDSRQNVFGAGFIIVGSIGCFVQKNGQGPFILSNNHVVAGENRGKPNDRILQSGNTSFDTGQFVAKLGQFIKIKFSPPNATVAGGDVIFNDADAGIARVAAGLGAKNAYLSGRKGVKPPTKIGVAKRQDAVSKVGRTTGLTRGTVTSIATIVGPVTYDNKPAWFRNSIEIEGVSGTPFSDHGDSGSAIVNSKGELVALLYAGNGTQTYACPIDAVVASLGITI
jgi:Trypsin